MSGIKAFILFTLFLVSIHFTTSQIIPPLARCEELGDNSTCLLTQVMVSKSRPNFRLRSPDPDQVRSVFIKDSVIPLLTGNICSKFLNMRSLTGNRISIEEIREDAFEDCTRLISVDLSENQIKRISGGLFRNSPALKYFYLESNFVKHVPDDLFKDNPDLAAFNMNHNRLKEVPVKALEHLHDLTVLSLHSNDILNLNEEKINELFPNLQTIELNNNQISCDRWFEIQDSFNEARVKTTDTGLPRNRYHEIIQIGNFFCVGDVDWTGIYYKRVAESGEIERLKEQVRALESQLEITLDHVAELLEKIVE